MTEAINIFFAGDFAPCRRFERLILEKGPAIFGNLQPSITGADLSFLNLESPLCSGGNATDKTGPNLNADPDCVKAIKGARFDVVGLANNHIMDFGDIGLEQTMNACKGAGLAVCGAGKNLDAAQQIPIVERRGLKIAVIAVAEHEFSIADVNQAGAAPLDPVDNVLQIESARKNADLVFVTIHGGNEYFPLPRPGLRKLCRFYVTRGADAVICHHAHVPGAYEIYEGKPIVYSLGNLIFDHPSPPEGWNQGYAVELTYNPADKTLSGFDVLPYTQSVAQGGVCRMTDPENAAFLGKLADYNKILGDDSAYMQAWDGFCQKEKKLALMKNYLPFHFRGMRKISRFINPGWFLVPTEKNRRVKLNMIRCESHLELLKTILSRDFHK